MGLVGMAVGIAVFSILVGLGMGEIAQYAQAKLPYTIVQRVVNAANAVNNAASSYIVQNTSCVQNGVNSCGLSANALAPNYLPYYSGSGSGVNKSANYFVTPDGTTIAVTPISQTTYQLGITPGPMLTSNHAYIQALANALPGSTISTNWTTIVVQESTPAISNMLASNKPAWGTLSDSTAGQTQYTNGGGLNTQGGPISSGGINTNGQPIYTNGGWIYGPNNNVYTNSANSGPIGNFSGYECIGWGEVKVSYISSYSSVMKWTYPYVISAGNSCNHTTQTWQGPWGWYPVGSTIMGQTNTPAGVSVGWANNASCYTPANNFGCTQELFF